MLVLLQNKIHEVFKGDKHARIEIVGGKVPVIQHLVIQQHKGRVCTVGDGRIVGTHKGNDAPVLRKGVLHRFQDGIGLSAFADGNDQPGIQCAAFVDLITVGADGAVAQKEPSLMRKLLLCTHYFFSFMPSLKASPTRSVTL